MRNIANANMQ